MNINDDFKKCNELFENNIVAYTIFNDFHYFMYYDSEKDSLYYYYIQPETYAYATFKTSLYNFIFLKPLDITFTFFYGIEIKNVPWLINKMIDGGVI